MGVNPYYYSEEWQLLRAATLRRDNYVCQYCGKAASQADHILPRSKSGSDDLSNLVACCKDCNSFFLGRPFKTFAEKYSFYHAYSPLKKKRAEGKVALEIELERLKWHKKSLVVTPEERRRIKRKLVKKGYFFRFRLFPFFCRYCHSTSKKGSRWPSPSCCPWCAVDLDKERKDGRPYSKDAVVLWKRNQVIEGGKFFHCQKCDAVISEERFDCLSCSPKDRVPF